MVSVGSRPAACGVLAPHALPHSLQEAFNKSGGVGGGDNGSQKSSPPLRSSPAIKEAAIKLHSTPAVTLWSLERAGSKGREADVLLALKAIS